MLPQGLTLPSRLRAGTGSRTEDAADVWTSLYRRLQRLYELPQERQRAPAVEGLRGVAVLLVFGVHFHALFSHYVAPSSLSFHLSALFWNIGHSGVDIFFALSGALIYEIVLKRQPRYGNFLVRRAQRIYPTFLAVFAMYVVLTFFDPVNHLPAGKVQAGIYLLENALLLPGVASIKPLISVAWSLSYEFAFYLFLPVLLYACAFHRRSAKTRVLLMCLPALALVVSDLIHSTPHKRALMFLAGMLVFEARNSTWFKSQLTRRAEVLTAILFVISFPAMVALSARPAGLPNIWAWPALIVLLVTDFWVVLFVTGFDGRLKKVASFFPLRWLGNISYSFYLLHGLTLKFFATALAIVLPTTEHGALLVWSVLPVGFAVAFLASTVLYAVVEKPLSLQRRTPAVVPGAVV